MSFSSLWLHRKWWLGINSLEVQYLLLGITDTSLDRAEDGKGISVPSVCVCTLHEEIQLLRGIRGGHSVSVIKSCMCEERMEVPVSPCAWCPLERFLG